MFIGVKVKYLHEPFLRQLARAGEAINRMLSLTPLLVAVAGLWLATLQPGSADLIRVDLSGQKWRLSNANNSISLGTTVPAHALSVLAAAGVVAEDPLYRYGELETCWVAEERWNFTLLWSSKRHELLGGCRQVLLVLHGIDTFGAVVLNGRHVLQADNAHRSWWVPLDAEALREGANMLSVVLQPAAAMAARAQAAYPYPVPTMQVPGGVPLFNWARKPAADFGWDWGPAFVPAGVTGGVELVGFDRATLIGALVSQVFNSSADTFDLTVTAQFVVPVGGDSGTLSLTFAVLDLHRDKQVELQPGVVGGNPLQALVTVHLSVPASRVNRWQPLTLAPKGKPRELYDLAVMFEPSEGPPDSSTPPHLLTGSTCGVAPDRRSSGKVAAGGSADGTSSSRSGAGGSSSSSSSSSSNKAPQPELRSTIVRRVGFRTVELVQEPIAAAAATLLGPQHHQPTHPQHQQHQQAPASVAAAGVGAATRGLATASSDHPQSVPKDSSPLELAGESFYLKVNGAPLFAKGANLIPLHVLSTAVPRGAVRALLQAAVDANMNMVRIWGGGRYQVDELYEAADELGLMVWQEAMFACAPYPRNGQFLSNVEAELTQQLLRVGSHASLVVFGGNNEVEQSLDWYPDTRANLAMYATDYSALFEETIGQLVQQMLPHTPWVDSSPSKGAVLLPEAPGFEAPASDSSAGAGASSANTPPHGQHAAAAAQASTPSSRHVKRWGNTNDPAYGDVHYYNYLDDCQDWRTYPHARFISEYGWQSYPTWPTYAAATAEEDWWVTASMTEYRQRHPNGTAELLAQLQRRFKLPAAWLDLLPQPQQPQQQQQQQPPPNPLHHPPAHSAPASQHTSASQGFVNDPAGARGAWSSALQCVHSWSAAASAALQPYLPSLLQGLLPSPPQAAAPATGSGTGSTSSTTPGAGYSTEAPHTGGPEGGIQPVSGLAPGRLHIRDGDAASPPAAFAAAAAAAAAAGRQGLQQGVSSAGGDMPHFVYLTQLQQMLCYETALHTWRRLRADPAALSMGVLYWQLNDVWAGASWSSVDYGGAWKPVHYGVSRAFADVSLNVQHDLQEDAISIHVVNDLQQLASVQLTVRLLSLTDTPDSCGARPTARDTTPSPSASSTTSSAHSSNADSSSRHADSPTQGLPNLVAAAAPYVKFQKVLQAEAPAGTAVLIWSKSIPALLSKAQRGQGCSRTSCYVHITLTGEGVPQQEAPVWLAPFQDLPLQDPQLSISSMLPVSLRGDEGTLLTASGHRQEGVAFTVSSQAVAAYAVWEVQHGGEAVPGHFADNALTIHPCEPRRVTFLPQPAYGSSSGGGAGSSSSVHLAEQQAGEVLAASSQGVDGAEGREGVAAGEAGSSSSSSSGAQAGQQAKQLVQLLQQQLVVTSLWDHQQFDAQQQQGGRTAERLAVV